MPAASDLWEHSGSVAELPRSATLGNTGWAHDTDYVFDVSFTGSSLDVSVSGSPELAITGSFGDGRFGFYNYSQPAAIYLPEPGANAGIVLAARFLTLLRRRGRLTDPLRGAYESCTSSRSPCGGPAEAARSMRSSMAADGVTLPLR